MSLVIEITETSPVVTEPVVTIVEVAGAGPQGAKGDTGDQGPVGPGVPAGGVEFDLIEKASADDFDTRFTDTPTVRGIQLSTTNPADVETGRIVWNDGDEVPQFRSNGITVDLSLEMLARCRNVTGTLIPKGTAVCIVGASAQRISIAPSNRTQPGSACRTLGLTLEDIANNGFGKVSTFGLVRGLNTAGIDGDEGDELFVGETPGSLTTTPPDAPARRLTVGYLVTKSVNQGRIFVSIRRGVRVDEIDDVQVDSVADGDVIRFDDANGRWENKPLGTAADADVGDFDAAGSAAAVQSNLETHIDDATNPHNVTKEQVGLGNVPNLDTTDAVNKAHDQNTDTALAAGTADEVTAADVRELLDGTGPQLFENANNHLTSLVAPLILPSLTPTQPARLWGPPNAPYSGQTPKPFGPCDLAFSSVVNAAGLDICFDISGAFRINELDDAVWIAVGQNEDNYWRFTLSRGTDGIKVFLATDGIETLVASQSISGTFGTNYHYFRLLWGRRDRPPRLITTLGDWVAVGSLSLGQGHRGDLTEWIGFGGVNLGVGSRDNRFTHVAIYGESLTSVGTLP